MKNTPREYFLNPFIYAENKLFFKDTPLKFIKIRFEYSFNTDRLPIGAGFFRRRYERQKTGKTGLCHCRRSNDKCNDQCRKKFRRRCDQTATEAAEYRHFAGIYFFNSILPIWLRCTSSGPSARRKVRACAYAYATPKSSDTPPPPCACIAQSIT